MTKNRLFIVLASAVVLYGCPPGPVNPPPDADAATVIVPPGKDGAPAPAGDAAADLYDAACAQLAAVGCHPEAEGFGGRSCAATMRANQKLFDVKPLCLAAAQDKAAAVRCGTVRCDK